MKKLLLLALMLAAPALKADPFPLTCMGPVTLTTATTVAFASIVNAPALSVQLTSITGTVAVCLESSLDGQTWVKVQVTNQASLAYGLTMTANGSYTAYGQFRYARVNVATLASGQGVVRINLCAGEAGTNPLVGPGSNGAASGGGSYVVSAGFDLVTFTARTGVTLTTATTTSLTWTAGTASGNSWTFELVNCAGATGIYWDVHDGAAVPATFSNNLPLGRYFACGSTFINPVEVYAPNNPHFTAYASGLSFTSATVSFKVYKRHNQ